MIQKIADIPVNERPREKAIRYGINSLSNTELLAILIKSGTKEESAIALAQRLINKYGGLDELFNADLDDLKKIKGVKDAKGTEIIAVGELSKRLISVKIYNLKSITHPSDLAQYFEPILRNEKQEKFIVVFLDIKNNILKYETLFKGGVNFSIIDVNVIFKKAIALSSSKIICIHNHPSGDVSPSKNDILISKKINDMGNLLEIFLLDHLIVGKGNYTSLKQLSYF